VLTLAFLFAALPFLSGLFWHLATGDWPQTRGTELIFYPNPYAVLGVNTGKMLSPRGMGGPTFSWPAHCAIIMAASAALLALCVSRVRKVALRQATGTPSDAARAGKKVSSRRLSRNAARPARRINGPPTLWKELRTPILRRHKLAAFVVISIAVGLLLLTYWSLEAQNDLDSDDVQIVYVIIFMSAAMLFNVVLPATAITSEKESRSWPLLLATTLDDGQILFGKFAGVVRRCLPAWAPLFGHLILFSFIGYTHPIAILQMAILAVWVIIFLTCTGLYFSARFKRTTTAVIMNFALVGFLWVLMPFLLPIIAEIMRTSDDLAEFYLNTNPLVHAVVIGQAACHPFHYDWPGIREFEAFESTCWMLLWMLCYIMAGLLVAWFAKRRFRRNIF
jgi:ABC-type transport system involved in multi-copper enzyme maturation permease subunit